MTVKSSAFGDRRLGSGIAIATRDRAVRGIWRTALVTIGLAACGGTDPDGRGAAINPLPVLTAISSDSVLVGSSDRVPIRAPAGANQVTVTLLGRNFLPTSQLALNTEARPSRYVDPTRIEGELSAANLAVPTEHLLSDYSTPREPTVGVIPFVVAEPGSRIRNQVIVEIENNDIAVDESRNLIYIAVPDRIIGFAGSIVAVDAATGAVQWTVPVDGDPAAIEPTSDGKWLYVMMADQPVVARIDLITRQIVQRIDISRADVDKPRGRQLEPVPGNPLSFLLSIRGDGSGVAVVFTDGLPRPSVAPDIGFFTRSATPSRYYALDQNGPTATLYILDVGPQGVSRTVTGFYHPNFQGRVELADGKLFTTSGGVADPVRLSLVSTLPKASSLRFDPGLGRLFHAVGTTLTVCDPRNFQVVDQLNLGAVKRRQPADPAARTRWHRGAQRGSCHHYPKRRRESVSDRCTPGLCDAEAGDPGAGGERHSVEAEDSVARPGPSRAVSRFALPGRRSALPSPKSLPRILGDVPSGQN